MLTCMDSRVNVERLLGLEQGDAHVIRNAGALVTEDVRRSLEASRSLGTDRAAVILHTDCGGRSGNLDEQAREAARQLGPDARAYVYDVETRQLHEVE